MAKVTRAAIDGFLAAKRIAVIGASRHEKEYSRSLYKELLSHGYDAIPVNPYVEELDGRRCYKNVKEISPAPERALIVLPEDKTEQAVIDCADAGVKDIWLHRHVAGGGQDRPAGVSAARAADVRAGRVRGCASRGGREAAAAGGSDGGGRADRPGCCRRGQSRVAGNSIFA